MRELLEGLAVLLGLVVAAVPPPGQMGTSHRAEAVDELSTDPASPVQEPVTIPANELEDHYFVLRPSLVPGHFDAESRRPDERVFVPGKVATLALGPDGGPELEVRRCELPEAVENRGAVCWKQLQPQRPDYLAKIGDVLELGDRNRLLTVLDFQGWEFNPTPLAVWRRQEDTLVLEGLGLPVLESGLSALEFREVLALGDRELLLLLKQWGGDGGQMWESLVVGRWLLPDRIQWLYSLGDCGDSWEEVKVSYELSDRLELTVQLPASDSGCATYPDGLEAHADLRALMALLDAGKTVVEAHRQLGLIETVEGPH